MKHQLRKHNLSFTIDSLKTEHLKRHKPRQNKHLPYDILSAHKHRVLSLPAYQRELNTTEKIWGCIKHWVRHQNGTFKLEKTWQQYEPLFAKISNRE
jgi:hypothetical protein